MCEKIVCPLKTTEVSTNYLSPKYPITMNDYYDLIHGCVTLLNTLTKNCLYFHVMNSQEHEVPQCEHAK